MAVAGLVAVAANNLPYKLAIVAAALAGMAAACAIELSRPAARGDGR